MNDAQIDSGVDGVGRIVPAEPLRPVGGASDGGDSGRRRQPGKPAAEDKPGPGQPRVPSGQRAPGHRIDEQA